MIRGSTNTVPKQGGAESIIQEGRDAQEARPRDDTVVFDDSTGCSLTVARNAKNQHLRWVS